MELKKEISAEELVKAIWTKKQFGINLLKNSMEQNKEEGQFQARIIIDTVDFCLQKILELQASGDYKELELEEMDDMVPFSLACFLCREKHPQFVNCSAMNATYTQKEKREIILERLGHIPEYDAGYVLLNKPCRR